MKKLILVDGNNLMYRSYYATIYSGSVMKNSKGEVTNALFGFTNMIGKIIDEEKPTYMAVAFDIGKNFRHSQYAEYKAGRQETPPELLEQMPKSREILDAMGIKHYEVENYEADDIIGTITAYTENDLDFDATIVSSDKDLLQLISDETDVKLLKQQGYIRYDEEKFMEDYGIKPLRMIDLKALAGDPSDNIPGVKGIGEKTALKLLQEYDSLEGIYANLENIKGAVKDKLITGQKDALFSKNLCTIYREVPLGESLEDMKYTGPTPELEVIYKRLEFYSFLKNMDKKVPAFTNDYTQISDLKELPKADLIAYYIEADASNYHQANILGMGIYDGQKTYYVPAHLVNDALTYYRDATKYTYDLKKNMCLLNNLNLTTDYDQMVAAYLLNYSLKDDLAYLMNNEGIVTPFYEQILKDESLLKPAVTLKAKYIFDTHDRLVRELKLEDMFELFEETEMPLVTVLAKMELRGIKCEPEVLKNMSEEVKIKIDSLARTIYNYAGTEFNIGSPKQLGEVLFDNMGLPHGKKTAKGYSTDASVLEKLLGVHPIIEAILEYRNLTKLNSTYLEGLNNYIMDDNLIHTIYKQTLTRTGRLSSVEPNLQNIPTRDEIGRKVRKAFVPHYDEFLAADYSQIELRVLAHISESEALINAFKNGEDIHTKVASDIFGVQPEAVSKLQRRTAKAVIFGIVYGISGFGLGENLNIAPGQARKLIDQYLQLYPGVKNYMDNIIAEARLEGAVRTLYHRKRVIDELNNKNYMIRSAGERIALNTPIQGTAADIIKMAMVKIDEILTKEKMQSKMILQVHDELIFDIVKSEKAKVEKIVKENMENIVALRVPIEAHLDYGSNWYET